MKDFARRAAAALELLPPELQEPAVAFLVEQGEKHRALREAIQEGIEDAEAGRTQVWNFDVFLEEARDARAKRRVPE
jgi:hypothetical protein